MTEQVEPGVANVDNFGSRQSYEPPKLICRGDVRELTLGGSPGTGDSGNPGVQLV